MLLMRLLVLVLLLMLPLLTLSLILLLSLLPFLLLLQSGKRAILRGGRALAAVVGVVADIAVVDVAVPGVAAIGQVDVARGATACKAHIMHAQGNRTINMRHA